MSRKDLSIFFVSSPLVLLHRVCLIKVSSASLPHVHNHLFFLFSSQQNTKRYLVESREGEREINVEEKCGKHSSASSINSFFLMIVSLRARSMWRRHETTMMMLFFPTKGRKRLKKCVRGERI